ncbi:ribonuclease P protein component [Patescibacteria group bacterium]|nr:ribonuclease P protein component [Patescibacteria group bacterium]
MLPKVNRLTKESDFKKIARGAKPTHSKFFILKKLPSTEKDTKFGIVISAKISKKATIRNKIRRQAGEIIRKNLSNTNTGYNTMIVVKNSILDKDFEEIKKDLESLLQKVRIVHLSTSSRSVDGSITDKSRITHR